MLESQAGVFVESRQYVGTLESGLEISGGDFRIIINQRDHALRGVVPDGDIRAKLRNSGEQSFLCSENGLCFRKRVFFVASGFEGNPLQLHDDRILRNLAFGLFEEL